MIRPRAKVNSRYDTHAHELTDYCADDEIFPGQDYSNPRIKDFKKGMSYFASQLKKEKSSDRHGVLVSHYDMETIDKRRMPRMPWHDIHVGMVRFIIAFCYLCSEGSMICR